MLCRKGFEDRWVRGPFLLRALFIRYLRRSAQSHARQSAHLLPTIFDFGFPGSNSGFTLRECALPMAQAVGGKLSLDERF